MGIAKVKADFEYPANNEIADNLFLACELHSCKWLSPWDEWNGAKVSNVLITLPRKFCIGGVAFKSVNHDNNERDPVGITV